MSKCRRLAAGALTVALSFGCSLMFPKAGLEHYVIRETGRDAVRCGAFTRQLNEPHVLSTQEAAEASRCMTDAYAAGKHFYFYVEGPGIDSHVAGGLLGSSRGLLRFKYDSAPCGGPACNESFVMSTCGAPTSGQAIAPDMSCPGQ